MRCHIKSHLVGTVDYMCMVIPKLATAGKSPSWVSEKLLPVPVTHTARSRKRHIGWQIPLAVVLVYILWRRFQ